MWSKPGATLATLFSLVLPTALAIVLLVVRFETEGALRKGAGHFDMIVGAKGGAMQLVLSSFYHLGMPAGNILYSDYQELAKDERIVQAVPIGLGDNYDGYRIVGTEAHLFEVKGRDEEVLLKISEGRSFGADTFEAVIGAQVASKTGLKIGDTFNGTHGLIQVAGAEVHTDFTYQVSGVLEPTGNSYDRAIYVPISAVWKVHHAEDSIHQVFQSQAPMLKEVTAVLVQLESAGLRLWMVDELKKKANLMPAVPINEILSLSQIYLEPFQKLLFLVTGGVIMVSCVVILLSLYQSVERRRPGLLVLRSLGAKRQELALMLFYEVFLLVCIGVLGGALVGHSIVKSLAKIVYDRTGLILDAWAIVPGEVVTLGSISLLLFILGSFPIVSLYKGSSL